MMDGSMGDTEGKAIVKEVVGTSFALVVITGDGQQITFQSGFAEDEDDAVVNARIDRLSRFASRQRAIADVPNLKKERQRLIAQRQQQEMDDIQIDAAYQAQIGDLDEQMAKLQEQRDDAFNKGYEAHKASGRQGSYEPAGAVRQSMRGALHDIEKLKADKQKAANERGVQLKSRDVFYAQIDSAVKDIDDKLAEAAKYTET